MKPHHYAALAAIALGLSACEREYGVRVYYVRGSQPLPVGDSVRLEATYFARDVDLFGGGIYTIYTSLDRPEAFAWSSSPPGVAAITEAGVIRALSEGEAVVQAETRGVTSDAISIRVVAKLD